MSRIKSAVLLLLLLHVQSVSADEAEMIRVGVLKFGTVNWELDVIKTHGLASRKGIDLKIVPLASKSATQVAIQGGAVDLIVSDWIWVSRQRAAGRKYAFVPYSTAVGSVMVNPDANIASLGDLRGKRLGVAGGPVDKSWLLLRVYSRQELGEDITDILEPNFAAPPLLTELLLRGELSAVLNFWHYSARLKGAGMKTLLSIQSLLPALGVETSVPLVGWVFHEHWANMHDVALNAFLEASFEAKKILAESDKEWQRLKPLIKVKDLTTSNALRDAYRAGIPRCFGEREMEAAKQLYRILAREGGDELVGTHRELSEGTFWLGYEIKSCKH